VLKRQLVRNARHQHCDRSADDAPDCGPKTLRKARFSFGYPLDFTKFRRERRSVGAEGLSDCNSCFGDQLIDTDRQESRRGGALVALEPQVFDLLVYLVQNPDRVVSKDDLLRSIWGVRR